MREADIEFFMIAANRLADDLRSMENGGFHATVAACFVVAAATHPDRDNYFEPIRAVLKCDIPTLQASFDLLTTIGLVDFEDQVDGRGEVIERYTLNSTWRELCKSIDKAKLASVFLAPAQTDGR